MTTSAAEWKKKRAQKELKLPSGHTCLARPIGMDTLVAQGHVPNSLLDIITESIKKAKGAKNAEAIDEGELFAEVLKDPEKTQDVFKMANAVTVACVVEPPVQTNLHTRSDFLAGRCAEEQVGQEIPPSDRDPDLLYVDEVDLDDKMFILSFAMGGSKDLEPFREATAAGVGAVPALEAVGDQAG